MIGYLLLCLGCMGALMVEIELNTKIYRKDNIYYIILVLDYNMSPVIKNKGSAIFIHIAKKNYSATKGCIAIKRNDIKKLASIINRKTLVKIL